MKKILIITMLLTMTFLFSGCNNDDNTEATTSNEATDGKIEQLEPPENGDPIAIIETSMGTIKIKLFPDQAPKTVENFSTHATNGYYNGITFHRVINDFMIQTGDPTGTGSGGESIWGEPFEDEFSELRNYNGAVSMANAGPGTNGSQFFIVENGALSEDTAATLDAVVANQEAKMEDMLQQMCDAYEIPKDIEPILNDDGSDKLVKDVYPITQEEVDKYKEVGGTPHLDGKHTVFGQVYEGMDVVSAIAEVPTDEMDKPIDAVTIESITITEYSDKEE